jgi:hypothetical protein
MTLRVRRWYAARRSAAAGPALPAAAIAFYLSLGYAFAQDAGALEERRARWASADISAYEYGYQKFCECQREEPPEIMVTVAGGSVSGVRYRYPGDLPEIPVEARKLEWYWTIEDLFELVETAMASSADLRVSYDEALGYPSRLYIDYDSELIGDEVDVRITRFRQTP